MHLAAAHLDGLQALEAEEARLSRRSEDLAAMERRIAAAQQRLDVEAEKLKRAVQAVEEEGAALKARPCWQWLLGGMQLLKLFNRVLCGVQLL